MKILNEEFNPELGTGFVKVWHSTLGVLTAYLDVKTQQEWVNLDSVCACFGKTKEEVQAVLEQGIKSANLDESKDVPKVLYKSTNGTEVVPYDYLWRLYYLVSA